MQQGMRRSTSSGLMARDMSPNSVIQTGGSNFSSTSGSAERCYLASEVSHELTGKECLEASSRGQDLEAKKVINILGHKGSHVSRQGKVKVQKLIGQAETVDELLYLDSARSSFSQALKECQDRRLKSDALSRKEERRSATLDLKKGSVMASQSGVFPSPGTPNYRHSSVGAQKGWSSERVPLNTNANRRHVNTAFLPYNNGRALPSKWEDAERWILSPVMGDCSQRSSFQQQQPKPKSKSGPLGPPGIAYHSMYSPAVPMFDRGNVGNVITNSQFSEYPRVGNPVMGPEPSIARSVSLHGYSELTTQSSLPGTLGKVDDTTDAAATDVSRTASRRDMATQMSPEGTPSSSCSPLTSPVLPVVELPRSEIRDVQVDEGVKVTRWSKKNKARIPGSSEHWKKKAIEFRSSSWGNSEPSKSISKVQREEAKIIAWENLQKAKAEAAIRKLEMKLEKKRSSSIDKIMNKLRSAQKKAQQMRSSVMANESQQVSKTSSSRDLSFRRTHQMGSLSGCFTCPAF